MSEDKIFRGGIMAQITTESVKFQSVVLGQALDEWGYDRVEVEKCLHELTEYREKIKSGDLVEVVRCKDCKKYMTQECHLCGFDIDGSCTGGPNNDFYCGNGERREPGGVKDNAD